VPHAFPPKRASISFWKRASTDDRHANAVNGERFDRKALTEPREMKEFLVDLLQGQKISQQLQLVHLANRYREMYEHNVSSTDEEDDDYSSYDVDFDIMDESGDRSSERSAAAAKSGESGELQHGYHDEDTLSVLCAGGANYDDPLAGDVDGLQRVGVQN
jgi:hypothetical protein